ncbi:hypothetical protein PTKIN_Ptkin03bG0074500 [Pterospermum kingtungense]
MEKGGVANWSEEVEDLVASGDTQGAISFLENLLSKLQTTSLSSSSSSPADDLKLASVLSDLASLYSSTGFSLKSDELLSRASLLRQRAHSSSDVGLLKKDSKEDTLSLPNVSLAGNDKPLTHGNVEKLPISGDDGSPPKSSSDDDWEAIADLEPNVILSSECLPGVSNLSLEDSKVEAPKRRGRGTFSYRKSEMYSDRLSDDLSAPKDIENENICKNPETKSVESLEALNHVHCPFTVRILDQDDMLLGSISARDLEPPRQRPQTSARTAQRMIAQGMGLKLPSSTFGSRELRNQEEARRNRIVTRQKLRDDAWGDD